MDSFQNLSERFAYTEDEKSAIKTEKSITPRASPRKKANNTHSPHRVGKRPSSYKYHKSEILYKHLDPLPDLLDYNLRLVFCGFNPGIKSAEIGHRYGHKSNDFWKILHESGIVDIKLSPEDDVSMPERYRIGFTELVMRPTKNIEEIPAIEMQHNVPRLVNTINTYKPKVLCLVGRGIWDSILKHFNRSKARDFKWGLQNQNIFQCKCFVVPSTSGLVTIPRVKKLEYWKTLKALVEDSDK